MTMRQVSEELLRTVNAAEPRLRQVGNAESEKAIVAGGWSRKEVLGHLIDSASNNHQRFVRAAIQDTLEFPGYDQDANVRLEGPQQADWELLIDLWATYNRYLVHVIARIPETKSETVCRIGSGEAVTLGFLAQDYLAHLVHHLRQIRAAD